MVAEIDVVDRRIRQLEMERVALEKESDKASQERLADLEGELDARGTARVVRRVPRGELAATTRFAQGLVTRSADGLMAIPTNVVSLRVPK